MPSKVWTEKNETYVLYCSSKTIAAGAFSQANHQLYYLWAWKWCIVRLCKPKIVGDMSKNVRIGICLNSVFCKKKIIRMTNVNSFRFLRSKLFQNHGTTLRKSIATFKSLHHVKRKPYTANDDICSTSDQT